MDKINYRFLNYKHYSSFKNALDNNRIKDDSIVFIQDKESIWARGKEYVFGGSYTSEAEGNTLTFKNGKDTALFTITQGNGAISFTDANGNTISATYIQKSQYDSFVESLSDVTHNGDLKTVAFTGSYEDLTSKPSIPIVDGELDANSTHAIQNKVVAEE